MNWARQNWLPVLLIVGLAVGLTANLNSSRASTRKLEHLVVKLHDAQLHACDLANGLRQESNRRLLAHQADKEVLLDFLYAARAARIKEGNLKTAAQYTRAIRTEKSKVRFRLTPRVDCDATIPPVD